MEFFRKNVSYDDIKSHKKEHGFNFSLQNIDLEKPQCASKYCRSRITFAFYLKSFFALS